MINQFSQGMQVLLQCLFENSCDVWRSVDIRQTNGSIRRDFTKIHTGFACRLSRIMSRRVSLDYALPQVTTQSDARLYLAADNDIEIGDRVDIMNHDQQYDVTEVFCYPSHMECSLKKVVEV